jgi:hypothetical protein
MKAKFLGITVTALLALSMILTAVGLAAYAVEQQSAASQGEQSVSQLNTNTQNSSDDALVSTFIFVCPFH